MEWIFIPFDRERNILGSRKVRFIVGRFGGGRLHTLKSVLGSGFSLKVSTQIWLWLDLYIFV
jgi:hypothetical protein